MSESTPTEVGSYFISNYPPFSAWNSDALPEAEAALQAAPEAVPLGLYLHIPFCRKRCKFCYFRVYTDKRADEIETYLAALSREIELVSELPCLGGRPFRFVYFGGGTPSFLSVRQLDSLVARLRANISWDQAEEVTFECEPGTLSQPKLEKLWELGITRLSLGIENFNDAILSENGRAHQSPEIFRAWDWITQIDFPSVNIDLIAGMVGESTENWRACVQQTIEMAPDSVTIYQMELPYNTVYSQDILNDAGGVAVADWPTKRDWVSYAFDELSRAGYRVSSAYTMVKDPQVKFSYRDNLWQGSDMLATGVASFGHISGVHYQNVADWNGYVGALDDSRLPLARALRLTDRQGLIREMILQIKRGYVDTSYFQRKFQVAITEEWADDWQELEARGLVVRSDQRLELTRQGLLTVDQLLPRFFESEYQGVRYT